MGPHPDYAKLDLPREFALGAHRLTPLSPAEAEEDFEAVMASAHVLDEVFGDWPAGLTLENNRIDLAWHEREFTSRRSYSWIIRDDGGAYVGCFYLYPSLGTRGKTEAILWLCDLPDRAALAQGLKTSLGDWLVQVLPSSIALTWITSPALEDSR
jgi:hypothetical protein